MGMEQYFRNAFFNPAKYADGILYVSNFAKNIHEGSVESEKCMVAQGNKTSNDKMKLTAQKALYMKNSKIFELFLCLHHISSRAILYKRSIRLSSICNTSVPNSVI